MLRPDSASGNGTRMLRRPRARRPAEHRAYRSTLAARLGWGRAAYLGGAGR
ncbi:MAG: hypothetical protein ACRDRK_10900 [Pseudonocardia sp.]